jgi:ATP-binding cassette subfamily B (MDR/TAP) protein 1
VQATSDFNRLVKLETNTEESRGTLRLALRGPIAFNHVGFSCPERADAPVLKDINLQIAEGECVAIVGPSGAEKSTVTALLQRLYQPHSGSILIGANDIAFIDVTHLRHHCISVVSQNPNFFDMELVTQAASMDQSDVSIVDSRSALEKKQTVTVDPAFAFLRVARSG